MSFATYRLKTLLQQVGAGATESRFGELEAVIKQDHNEAPSQVYSEITTCRLAALVGVEVACGALVAHDTGLRFASLILSGTSIKTTDIETKDQIDAVIQRYPIECARLAVFDLWIGNDDRLGNLRANIDRSSEQLIVAIDHGRALLGGETSGENALALLNTDSYPADHPFTGKLSESHCIEMVSRIQRVDDIALDEACLMTDTCGAVTLPLQAELASVMAERRQWLPHMVSSALQPI